MAQTLPKIAVLTPTKAPNQPIAPTEYSQDYITQLNNAHRLYFNQIDNFTQAASIPDAGTKVQRPTLNLQVGYQFFDTSLGTSGLPIWWDGFKWINASGTAV